MPLALTMLSVAVEKTHPLYQIIADACKEHIHADDSISQENITIPSSIAQPTSVPNLPEQDTIHALLQTYFSVEVIIALKIFAIVLGLLMMSNVVEGILYYLVFQQLIGFFLWREFFGQCGKGII